MRIVQPWVSGLVANLAVAPYDVLVGGELAQRHGAPGVQLLGADADLRAEPELGAVGEASGRVDDDGAAVDRVGEAGGGRQLTGEDGLGVSGREAVHVLDGGVERRHDCHAYLE